ncbi:probable auxin efflux carrier component 8 isoform X2 [Amborella trichopoda]|uniref:probable auxin efflux carrier component 8 isoform X2 n=1 Tax=Amborella trichopoda TaxID=13333 RepID=UPI0009BDB347|nr:probable auxin efflux carrier component 8 isoform X2 [Amborella trichopoda]|eukprot:XP_020528245.1 probable auxin efflux carrier component 8 isoform X2 [Amborella trichopoda]
MITASAFYDVFTAMVPLYVAMFLAYGSVKWWRIFTTDQCSVINRFVAIFAIPFLSLQIISSINPYQMNLKFILADTLQKLLILFVLVLWGSFSSWGSLDWVITLFSISTLPNTLIIGIPLLRAMYGVEINGLLVQIVVLQGLVWYTLLLFLFELKAKIEMGPQIPVSMGSQVGSDVSPVHAQSSGDLEGDGEMHSKEIEDEEAPSKDSEDEGEATCSSVKMIHLFFLVLSKVIKNPNTYASVLGLVWGLIACRWNIHMPKIVQNSISILADAGLGMAMFSLGLFMASQNKIIACGKRRATLAMVVRFLLGPAVMAACSLAVGLRGKLLHVAIVQGRFWNAGFLANNIGLLRIAWHLRERDGGTKMVTWNKLLKRERDLERHKGAKMSRHMELSLDWWFRSYCASFKGTVRIKESNIWELRLNFWGVP